MQRHRPPNLVNLSGQLCGSAIESRCIRFRIQRALEERCILRGELAELIPQLSNNAPVFMPAIDIARSLEVGSMMGGGPAQFVKDSTVVRVDGMAAATRLASESSHCRAT